MHADANRAWQLPSDWASTVEQLADLVQRLLHESSLREQQAAFPEEDDGPSGDRTAWQRTLDRLRESLLARQLAIEQFSRKLQRLTQHLADEQSTLLQLRQNINDLSTRLASLPSDGLQ